MQQDSVEETPPAENAETAPAGGVPNEDAPDATSAAPPPEGDEAGDETGDEAGEAAVPPDGDAGVQADPAPDAGAPAAASVDPSPAAGAPEGPSSALETLVGADRLRATALEALEWAKTNLLTLNLAIEAAVLFAALLPATLFGPRLKRVIRDRVAPLMPYGALKRAANALATVATPIALYLTLQIAVVALNMAGRSSGLVAAGTSLLAAWIVIRLVTLVIRSPLWSRVAFYVAWPLAALDAFGVLGDVVTQLNAFAIPIGETEDGRKIDISALEVVRGLITFGFLFWLAGMAGRFAKDRINDSDELTVSFKALLAKILDILLPVVALLVALQLVNFPFGALAVFGGAIGIGVGLGLQRTVSNFAAGFTLIADKSIKPGDVIEVSDTFGWVTEMNARYVAIRTRDGTAHLIPNDKFIEDGVVNWSHADKVVRLHAGVGVSYDTKDLRFVKTLCEETAASVDRVVAKPAPVCNLVEFGDSSVNFDLRFWIEDPRNGLGNVRSDVLLAIWDKLRAHDIEIPFPQRDLHIRSATPEALEALDGSAITGSE